MKSQFNLSLVIGMALLLAGFVLANHIGSAVYGVLPAVEAPRTHTDDPVFALPLYLARVLFQAAGPLRSFWA
jgi:hypothetical protein